MSYLNELACDVHGWPKKPVFQSDIDTAFMKELDELIEQRNTLKQLLHDKVKKRMKEILVTPEEILIGTTG